VTHCISTTKMRLGRNTRISLGKSYSPSFPLLSARLMKEPKAYGTTRLTYRSYPNPIKGAEKVAGRIAFNLKDHSELKIGEPSREDLDGGFKLGDKVPA